MSLCGAAGQARRVAQAEKAVREQAEQAAREKKRAFAEKRGRELAGEPRTLGTSYERWGLWQAEQELDEAELADRQQADDARRSEGGRRAAAMGCNSDKSAEREIFELSTAKKLEAARAFKRRGTAFFGEGQFYRAAGMYRRMLVYFDYTFPDTEAEQAELDTLTEQAGGTRTHNRAHLRTHCRLLSTHARSFPRSRFPHGARLCTFPPQRCPPFSPRMPAPFAPTSAT